MFHAQNRYMTNPAIYPMKGRGTPQEPNEWSGEIGTADQLPIYDAQLQMKNSLPHEVVEAPITAEEAYKGSLKSLLNKNLGNFIVATFLVGTQGTTTWEGVLYDVGNDYLAIYQEARDRFIVGDIYSLKFIEFYDLKRERFCPPSPEIQPRANP